MQDPLVEKAIKLRDTLHTLRKLAQPYAFQLPVSEQKVMLHLQNACATCVEMGAIFLDSSLSKEEKETYQIFDTLVDMNVIDRSLSRRLLSLICFGKLVQHAQQLKGKTCKVNLREKHLEDMRTFTQNLLLA